MMEDMEEKMLPTLSDAGTSMLSNFVSIIGKREILMEFETPYPAEF